MVANPSERRAELYALLGDLPPRERPIAVTSLGRSAENGYTLETLALDLNGFETVPAYFVKPLDAHGALPTILFNHSHGGNYTVGKREFIEGGEYLASLPYAFELTRAGYAALCIDHWLFGERRGRSEGELFREMLWKGQVLWGMMLYDSLRAVDYLTSRADVDVSRIGTLGMSMGSTMAWYLSALDTRIKVCVDLCCLTDFHALMEAHNLERHGLCIFIPGLLKHFTTAQINALIAPRPHLALAGNYDVLTPAAGLERIDAELRKVYGELGVPDHWCLKRYEIAHLETTEMRQEVMNWLRRWL
jgi:dienelactone hydrolase